MNQQEQKKKENLDSPLTQYGKNLTDLARHGNLDPVIGREQETDRLIRILCRKTKNNPCLIGDAGVGKTAIIEGLAIRIACGNVPPQIKEKNIISVDLTSMVAGAKYRGDFEERIKGLINEATKNKSVILFIDEIHTIVGAGSAEGAIDAANILKPQLSRAEIQLIGATTYSEYHKYIEKDAALERRFQALKIEEPSREKAIEILKGLREKYEAHHDVIISDEAIESAVILSERYIPERFLPDKAIDVLDEACAKSNLSLSSSKSEKSLDKLMQIQLQRDKALLNEDYALAGKLRDIESNYKFNEFSNITDECNSKRTIKKNDIEEIINEITGIPATGQSISRNGFDISKNLKKKIFGQDEAIDLLTEAVMRSESGINNPERPKGVFLFLGKSGVGKTELAKALAEELFYDKKELIKFDMSEYSEKNSVTKLIGSPPGYVGYEEGGALTEKIRRHPYSVILFDEIEKAHNEVLNLFLQIMDEGVLTDSCGRKVSFKNAYIIMTSNAGSSSLKKTLGFNNTQGVERRITDFFTPEFINRIDCIIEFSSLNGNSISAIANAAMMRLCDRLKKIGINLEYTERVCNFISEQCKNEEFCGRSVHRIINHEIEAKISSLIINNKKTKNIFIDVLDNELSVSESVLKDIENEYS